MVAASRLVVPLLVAAGAALVAWGLLLTVLAQATRPRQAEPAPPAMDLPGPEPPAVANFLGNEYEVSRAAVPATVLDLAARRYVEVEQASPGEYVVRLRRPPAGAEPLHDYEQQVLDHLHRTATDGTVPCEALTTGPQDESEAWWKRFSAAVVEDAKARGLTRGRWGKGMLGLLAVTALVPAALASLAFALSSEGPSGSDSSDDPVGAFVALTVFAWILLMAIPWSMRAQRETPAGMAAASRWLGLRQYLEDHGQFPTLPPTAVAVWDRYLAYGAALGLAAAAVEAMPLGAQSPYSAWSAYGGRWREVRITYPRRLGWGKHPGLAVAQGLVLLLAAGGFGRVVLPDLAGALFRVAGDRTAEGSFHPAELVFGAMVAVFGLFVVVAAAYGLNLLVRGVLDLSARRVVEGPVLRLHHAEDRHYVAVDDGRSNQVRAWLLPGPRPALQERALVRATVSPRLGHLFAIDVVRPPVPRAAPVPAGSTAAPPRARSRSSAADLVDLSELRALTGLPLEPRSLGDGPGARSAAYGQGERIDVIVSVTAADDPVSAVVERGVQRSGFLRRLLKAQDVPGLGEEARWYAGRSLVVRQGGRNVSVVVNVPGLRPAARLDLARAIAGRALDRLRRQEEPETAAGS